MPKEQVIIEQENPQNRKTYNILQEFNMYNGSLVLIDRDLG